MIREERTEADRLIREPRLQQTHSNNEPVHQDGKSKRVRERESEKKRGTQRVFCLQANGEACDCAHISAITQLTSDPAQCEEPSHRETDEIDHKQVHNSKPPLTSSMRPSQTYLKRKKYTPTQTRPYILCYLLLIIYNNCFLFLCLTSHKNTYIKSLNALIKKILATFVK